MFSLYFFSYHDMFGCIYCEFGVEDTVKLPYRNYHCNLTGLQLSLSQDKTTLKCLKDDLLHGMGG